MRTIPTLLITGTIGSGKTSVAEEVANILRARRMAHAVVDLDWLGQVHPGDPSDGYNQRLIMANLKAMWPNLRDAGAERLILARVVEDRSELLEYERAVPGAAITVMRLKTSQEILKGRTRSREGELTREWHLTRMVELDRILDDSRPEDHLVINEGKTLHEVALEVLDLVGWG